jgi:TatD DNase family protein
VWFDSHCHLHLCEESGPLEGLVARARAAGVGEILTAGIDVGSSERSTELASSDGVFAAVGVHPNSATGWNEDTRARIEALIARPGVVAVGESGLDFFRDEAPREDQEEAFTEHMELARRHDKALIIHTRASVDAALDLLGSAGAPERVVFHCWSGDPPQLERALTLGAFVSFAGNVSFPRSEELRAAARLVPDDRLLVETDSPFLTPAPHRGRPNEPANVVLVGSALAQARRCETEEIESMTSRNARVLFGLER